MEKLTLTLRKTKDTKNKVAYGTKDGDVIQSVYIDKDALGDVPPATLQVAELDRLADRAGTASSLDTLLGIEGAAARTYFSEFQGMIKGQVHGVRLPGSKPAASPGPGERRPLLPLRHDNQTGDGHGPYGGG